MAFKLYSDVREISTTGGTGDQVLTGSAFDASYFRFNSRYADGDTFFYNMKQGVLREFGLGTRVTVGDKIARTQVYGGSNGTGLVNFAPGQSIDICVTWIAPADLDTNGRVLLRTSFGIGTASVRSDLDFVRTDLAQGLTKSQQQQARANIGAARKNYAGNSGMRVSLENGNAAGTVNGYFPADQWFYNAGHDGTVSVQRVAVQTPGGGTHAIQATVTGTDTSLSSSQFAALCHRIEGSRVADLFLGTASAKTIVVSFGVKGPALTYSVAVRNLGAGRNRVQEFTISPGEANVATRKSLVFPLDQAGAWSTAIGTVGIELFWTLAAGSGLQTAQGVWTNGNAIAGLGQSNFLGTNGNVLQLFDVDIYEGSVEADYILPDFDDDLEHCQRYLCRTYVNNGGNAAASGVTFVATACWPVEMCKVPSVSLTAGTRIGVSSASIDNSNELSCRHLATSSGGGPFAANQEIIWANARL